jgi:hypothetical protein
LEPTGKIGEPPARAAGEAKPGTLTAVDAFLTELAPQVHPPSRCIVLLSGVDSYAIYDPNAAAPIKDPASLRTYFRTRAQEMGYRVLEVEDQFRQDYALHGQRLEFWPVDRHWNGAATASPRARRMKP